MLKLEVKGSVIKRLRLQREQGATQKEFAHEVRISERRLRQIENAGGLVTVDVLDRMSRAFGVHRQDLCVESLVSVGAGAPRDQHSREAIIPRHDTAIADVVASEAELFELGCKNQAVLCHALVALTAETSRYLEEIFAILRSLCWGDHNNVKHEGKETALPIRRRLRELLVLLKGNDVWVYQTTNYKLLPERDLLPEEPDPFDCEVQLIIAAGPPGEYGETSIHVPVDNGQPRRYRAAAVAA